MSSKEMEKYLSLFLEESRERLRDLDKQILTLEKNPKNIEMIDEMFRVAHTLKGMAATMGYKEFSKMTHKMENLMDAIRKKGLNVDEKTIELLFECRDTLDYSVDEIEKGNKKEIDYSDIISKLDNYLTRIFNYKKNITPTVEKALVEQKSDFENSGKIIDFAEYSKKLNLNDDELKLIEINLSKKISLYLVIIKLHDNTDMKYARAYLCIKKVRDFSEILKLIPDETQLKAENFNNSFQIVCLIKEDKKIKYLRQDIESVAAVEKIDIIILKKSHIKEKKKKIISKKTGNDIKDLSIQNVKVSIKHLDNLMNMTGELLISKIRLEKIAQNHNINSLNETLIQINRITFELQDEVLQMRMVPVSQIFDRFPRMVRDLSKTLGKLIDFSMEGRDIELDRSIIDQIADPIVHLLRNSIDHGIETTENREKAGKPKIASLELSAYRDRNFVIIEVSDDGHGINFDKIKEKALKKGIITKEDSEKMTEYDQKRLLLGGGISTSDDISIVSGRGVGLGVVRKKIENLGGIIELDTKLGKGTTFRLKLPLTVAIIKSLLVSIGSKENEEIFAIPITNVVRTIVIHEREIRTIKNKEVITIMGKIVSIFRLRNQIKFVNKFKKDEELDSNPMKTIIIIDRGEIEMGLLVDNLIGQQEIVIKSLGDMLKGIKGISGGAILGDGRVALIIDVSSLF